MVGCYFSTYVINDIVGCINDVSLYLYADDLAILVSASSVARVKILLQQDLNEISAWCSLNRLTIHTEKTEVMWCHSNHQNPDLSNCLQVHAHQL